MTRDNGKSSDWRREEEEEVEEEGRRKGKKEEREEREKKGKLKACGVDLLLKGCILSLCVAAGC